MYKGLQSLSPSRILFLQTSLTENSSLTFLAYLQLSLCPNISQTLFTPGQRLSKTPSTIPLTDKMVLQLLLPTLFNADGSSFLSDGHHIAGYAVASDDAIVEVVASSSPHIPNQQAELIALTRAFQIAESTSLTVQTPNRLSIFC